ncbi:alginate lyase family protein [Flavobacterium sp.]|uniref:heparinase II/III family protein n=1 Tax=Flavobacterium sp. TaxID=239 RepID=UPI000A4523C1|nr:alginate lyase family protein [Flavobacterium sp.]HCF03046.1 heparinase [Flavobacterium sp.]
MHILNYTTRLYHTIKYLKLKQIVWRFLYLFPRSITDTKSFPIINSSISFNGVSKNNVTLDYDNFTFLNETHQLLDTGWDDLSISKLWRYNLHYFDFLRQKEQNKIEFQKNIVYKWIIENPYGKGTGWEPYPTSLRIVNWIKWHWDTKGLTEEGQLSLWNQVRWLAARPEYHLLGNHLFVNIKALLFACVFFNLDEKSIIYKKAIKILSKELNEQFLSDGAHFELSPMYHALAMEDLLDLYQLTCGLPPSFPTQKILDNYFKGMHWLSLMKYNNNELSHFNDCANGIAPSFNELNNLALELGLMSEIKSEIKFHHFEESGFGVYKEKDIHLIIDIGHIGPDYLPGHAHADTLSFELAIKGNRVIVNSGTSEYGFSKERLRQRSTSAHSTIEIDGKNSSEVWSGFRVARRAIISNIVKTKIGDSLEISATHNGYKRLLNRPKHNRKWNVSDGNLDIIDEVTGKKNNIQHRLYIHPDIQVEMIDNIVFLNKLSENLVKITSDHKIHVVSSTYHDSFGSSKKNKCILINGTTPFSSKVSISWSK